MSELLKIIVPVVLGCMAGILSAFFTTRFKVREFKSQLEHQMLVDKAKEKAGIRLKYLNPLRVAATDLYERISFLKEDRAKIMEIKNGAHFIKYDGRHNKQELPFWCNGVGHNAMSIIYVTALYFSQASKIRSELPFVELSPGDDQALLKHLSTIRTAFGGQFGIWETIQDSIGAYLRNNDGTIINYKEFCSRIIDDAEYVWFIRLIDFYRDIDMKDKNINDVTSSLDNLIGFLKDKSRHDGT